MIHLFDVPHVEARKLVAGGAPVYLTVNPVEFHGPHLSLHNDKLVSLGLIRDLHARLAQRHPDWPLLVAADLEIGVEPTPGLGTRHASYLATVEQVREACNAIAELGARRVVLMTFHGAPLHNVAIDHGVQRLRARNVHAVAPFNLVLRAMLTLDASRFAEAFAHIDDPDERTAMMRDLRFDFHAGFFETSLALHYGPETVSPSYRDLTPCPPIRPVPSLFRAELLARAMGASELAGELAYAARGLGWYGLKPFPGYTGRPHRAVPEAGALFARFIVDVFEPVVEEVLSGRGEPPPPIMSWLRFLTVGGRFGAPHVAAGQMARFDA
jgi:creatinine amidohydrolase